MGSSEGSQKKSEAEMDVAAKILARHGICSGSERIRELEYEKYRARGWRDRAKEERESLEKEWERERQRVRQENERLQQELTAKDREWRMEREWGVQENKRLEQELSRAEWWYGLYRGISTVAAVVFALIVYLIIFASLQ